MIGLRGLKAKWEPRALKKLNQREKLVSNRYERRAAKARGIKS
jgi:hypothetical protein